MKKQNLIITILIPIIIILFASKLLVLNESYHINEHTKLNTYQNFNKTELDQATHNLIQFFKNKEPLNIPFYTETENTHMQEVKSIIKTLNATFYISIILFIFLAYKNKNLKQPLKNGSILTLIILALLALPNFNTVFIKFHELFINTQWLYPESSKLIQMFPYQFFINITSTIAIISASIAILILAITLIKQRRKNNINEIHNSKLEDEQD